MVPANDDHGDVFREFYATFGRPNEGPSPEDNVTELMYYTGVDGKELDILRSALRDTSLRRQFLECQEILEDLATRLGTQELINDLSGIIRTERDVEELSNGVLWLTLAVDLGKRNDHQDNESESVGIDNLYLIKRMQTVQGSLVFQLYIALVYMREGVLTSLIAQGIRNGSHICTKIRKLLNTDYVRRIRNALSHGTFSPCAAGLVFRDVKGTIVGTPGFLGWLCMWLMLIQFQAAAGSDKETALH